MGKNKDKKRKLEEEQEKKEVDEDDKSSEASVDDDQQPLLRGAASASGAPSPSRNPGASNSPRKWDHLTVSDQASCSPSKRARYPRAAKPATPKSKLKMGKQSQEQPASTKNEDFSQSSSSSDPSVRSSSRARQSREGNQLAVPSPKRNPVASSPKRSPVARFVDWIKKKSPSRSSGSNNSNEENGDSESSDRMKQTSHSKGKYVKSKNVRPIQIKSESSSTSTSPRVSKKSAGSHASSSSSRRSNSKSSSTSDPSAARGSPLNISSGASSGNWMDMDPQEGTSSGSRTVRRGVGALEKFQQFAKENVISGGESGDEIPLPDAPHRPKAKSFDLRHHWRRAETRGDKEKVNEDIPTKSENEDSNSLDKSVTEKLTIKCSEKKTKGKEKKALPTRSASSQPNAERSPQPVVRGRSWSPPHPCDCENPRITHEIGCDLFISLRRRRKRKKCRQEK